MIYYLTALKIALTIGSWLKDAAKDGKITQEEAYELFEKVCKTFGIDIDN